MLPTFVSDSIEKMRGQANHQKTYCIKMYMLSQLFSEANTYQNFTWMPMKQINYLSCIHTQCLLFTVSSVCLLQGCRKKTFSNYFLSFLNPKKLFSFEISLSIRSVALEKFGKNIFPCWKKNCSTWKNIFPRWKFFFSHFSTRKDRKS